MAARRDLADVELADRVFAPHYARAMAMRATGDAAISTSAEGGDVVGSLASGDYFRVLELTDRHAWGQAGRDGPVGYVMRTMLAPC